MVMRAFVNRANADMTISLKNAPFFVSEFTIRGLLSCWPHPQLAYIPEQGICSIDASYTHREQLAIIFAQEHIQLDRINRMNDITPILTKSLGRNVGDKMICV